MAGTATAELVATDSSQRAVLLVAGAARHSRVDYGVALLAEALREVGTTVWRDEDEGPADVEEVQRIVVASEALPGDVRLLQDEEVLCHPRGLPTGEGFAVRLGPDGTVYVVGGDASGALYGCQELARLVRSSGGLPRACEVSSQPAFALRGLAIGLQKTTVEPPRSTYDYPVTPARFPWFYDKELWLRFLDQLFEDRANVVFLWSGHPFSSFVNLSEYPEALDVTEEQRSANEAMLDWLVREADRRGIWVVVSFYNIHLPLGLALARGVETHLSKPTPLAESYYREAISAFVARFPEVGLMVTLGEALQGQLYGASWLAGTLLPAIKEGLQAAGVETEPPVIIRAHGIDAPPIVAEGRSVYPKLYTMAKYNGESLTTDAPRGRRQAMHRDLSAVADVHVANVHILANLEPFRWGAPSFVQRCAQAMRERLGARGLHLYPLFYWDWPVSPDNVQPRLLQVERDWIWYRAWFRYAWDPDRDAVLERQYWLVELGARFGERAAPLVLDIYELIGEVAPRLLRRFGITEGNRQTFSLGMTLAQLANPERFVSWPDLWECYAPRGERIEEFVKREVAGEPHIGETPEALLKDLRAVVGAAWRKVRLASSVVEDNREEFERIRGDVDCLRALFDFYDKRVRAAIRVLRYKSLSTRSGDLRAHLVELEEAEELLADSLTSYEQLAVAGGSRYLYANSMQTQQRKIPFADGLARRDWKGCLPLFNEELELFRHRVGQLVSGSWPGQRDDEGHLEPLEPSQVRFLLHSGGAETFEVAEGASPFIDTDNFFARVAERLRGLRGVRFSQRQAAAEGSPVEFSVEEPCQVLVGFFGSSDGDWAKAPSLEEDADADRHGGWRPRWEDAVAVYACPPVTLHSFSYPAGRHLLAVGQGAYLVLGFVSASADLSAEDERDRWSDLDIIGQLVG